MANGAGKVPPGVRVDYRCGCVLVRVDILILCPAHRVSIPKNLSKR